MHNLNLTITGAAADVKISTAAVHAAGEGCCVRFDKEPWRTRQPLPAGLSEACRIVPRPQTNFQTALAETCIHDGPARKVDGLGVTDSPKVVAIPLAVVEKTSRRLRSLSFRLQYQLEGHRVEATIDRGRFVLGAVPAGSDAASQ